MYSAGSTVNAFRDPSWARETVSELKHTHMYLEMSASENGSARMISSGKAFLLLVGTVRVSQHNKPADHDGQS